MPIESDATKGSAAKSAAERYLGIVRGQAAHKDPPVCRVVTANQILAGVRARDPATSAGQALHICRRNGDLITFESEGTRYVGEPTPEVVRAALGGEPTREEVRDAIKRELSAEPKRKSVVAACNQLLARME
jgi:hypothetical protein